MLITHLFIPKGHRGGGEGEFVGRGGWSRLYLGDYQYLPGQHTPQLIASCPFTHCTGSIVGKGGGGGGVQVHKTLLNAGLFPGLGVFKFSFPFTLPYMCITAVYMSVYVIYGRLIFLIEDFCGQRRWGGEGELEVRREGSRVS